MPKGLSFLDSSNILVEKALSWSVKVAGSRLNYDFARDEIIPGRKATREYFGDLK